MIYHKAYYIVFANFQSTLTSCCFSPSTVSKQPILIFEISLFRTNGVNSVTLRQSLTVSLNCSIDTHQPQVNSLVGLGRVCLNCMIRGEINDA